MRRWALTGIVLAQVIQAGLAAFGAGLCPRIEASFNIPGLASDPFDYAVTDVRVQVRLPDSSTLALPAFFDGGTTWRVRHTPASAGSYQVTGVTLNGSPQTVSNLTPTNWLVGGIPTSSGFVRLDPSNTNRFITSDGQRFFPLGHDVAWDAGAATVTNVFAKMGVSHENWSRVWMDHWDGKNLDWPNSGSPASGQLNLTVAQKWDGIVAAADQNGVHFNLVLQHHGQYSSNVDPNWPQNPYNVANGGFLTDATQFFTNATARALTKRKLRYAVARWGYSPAIMGWELFNEVQFTDAAQAGQWNIIGAWHDEMAQFIRAQDAYHHLITTSSDLTQPIWNQADYYQHHDYVSDYISALADPPGVPPGQPLKPIFGGEAGRDNTVFYGQHAPVWAGLMGGQSGGAEPWYWDLMDSERCYSLMRAAQDFVLRSGLPEQNSIVRSIPSVASPQSGSLVFAPGGGWATATQDTFTVSNAAPAGIGTLPSYFQGDYHRGMTPNGYTFLVDYPQSGTFSVQIVIIAASGAGLQIIVDNSFTNAINFPATGSDVNTNFTLSVSVVAGPHTIKLWNPGLDWVDLGNITLTPYVSILGAYQIGNSNFASVWLWNRTNIYNPSASVTAGGTFPLSGLAAGSYRGTWWDTFLGVAVSNFTFTASGTNSVTITTPQILRSSALFVGRAPATSVNAPALTWALGTNSPALSLPLSLTNGGGFPVAYSLSVTGASPVLYADRNSSQPGGPAFAWRDISGLGQEISSSFTQLAAPKTARDEGIAGPFNIGFDFPFFSGSQVPGIFKQVYVSPNGFITFSPFAGDRSTNTALPNLAAPTNMVALFWDDLDLTTSGSVYVDSDPLLGTFTIQYQGVMLKGSAATVTCQIILKTTGEIFMQYKSLGVSNTCTVGLQNAAANQGLQLAFNQAFLSNNFAVQITPVRWLSLSANAGLVPQSQTANINVMLDPTGLGFGSYNATLVVNTDDSSLPVVTLPVVTLPVQLTVSSLASWRQAHFGTAANSGIAADSADPDADGIPNILEYAFNTDPNVANQSPISFALISNHLTLTFKRIRPAPPDITYLYQVADALTGPWQSGPAWTTQTTTDNGNGTETVTVTDNLSVSAQATHFLRIVITSP